MHQINTNATHDKTNMSDLWPIFGLAFRPFFWAGALFSAIGIAVWGLTYSGNLQFSPLGGSYFWHAHEMLFGFTAAIIVGFLLTAVQTWTGVSSIKGLPLAGLFTLWVAARITIAFPDLVGSQIAVIVDVLFLPVAALALSVPLVKVKMWRNLFFIPVLLLMAILNASMHLSLRSAIEIPFSTISHVMILLVTLVMCIMAGRVFPMFTANGTQTEKVLPIALLEKFSIASIIAALVVASDQVRIHQGLEASIYLFAGLINFFRALRWRIWVTWKTPLVWSLHLSYWGICCGLVLLGLAKLSFINSESIAIHALTIGGVGLMILAMISRVSLGHTGRPLQVSKLITLSFILILVAFMVRVIAPMIIDHYRVLVLISAGSWVAAYLIFAVVYTPVLFKPRADGRSG